MSNPTTQCEICGYTRKVGLKGPAERCTHCGHRYEKQVQFCVDDIIASSETHNRYSWFCGECESRGTKWVEKALDLPSCPKCNSPLLDRNCRSISSLSGRCKTIWEPGQMEPKSIPAPLPIKVANCLSCGHGYSFGFCRPNKCSACGAVGKKFKHIKVQP